MDARRLRWEEWLAGVSGVVLLVAMFLPWYRYARLDVTHDAWQSFAALDLVLAAVAVMAIGVAVMAAMHPTAAVPIALTSLLGLVGLVGTAWLAVRAASPPSLDLSVRNLLGKTSSVHSLDASRQAGVWIGLAGCLGATVAALVGMRDERYPRAVREGSRLEVESMPAPPPEGTAEGSA
ncbi:MAG: hypothetical protein ACJ77M_08880 [Thermoleophilaceae bacterium]